MNLARNEYLSYDPGSGHCQRVRLFLMLTAVLALSSIGVATTSFAAKSHCSGEEGRVIQGKLTNICPCNISVK